MWFCFDVFFLVALREDACYLHWLSSESTLDTMPMQRSSFCLKVVVSEIRHRFCLDAIVEVAPNELHCEWSRVFIAGSRTHILLPLQCSAVGKLECRLVCSEGVERHLCLDAVAKYLE